MIGIVSIFNAYPHNTIAKESKLSPDCKYKTEQKYNQFVDNVFDDVLTTYEYLNKENDDSNKFYFTLEELFNVQILVGSNESVDSLKQFFTGGSTGERRLYLINGEPKYSYLLYKDTSHNNVMIKLKKLDGEWVEVDKKVKKGKKIELTQPRCYQDYN